MRDLLASWIGSRRFRSCVWSSQFSAWPMWLRQGVCGYRGHLVQLRRQPDRLWLTCDSCHYESPGWTLQTWRVRFQWMRSRRDRWDRQLAQIRRVSA